MKRIFLFIATNIAVIAVMSVVLSLLGVDRFISQAGLNLPMLLVFSLVVGFTGSIISLLISKPMAKWSTGARVIDAPSSSTELWLIDTVSKLAQRAGIKMPEVAVYDGEPNAFATGAFRDSALVAVSTGLLQSMTKDEVEAVLAHEVAHVANGDMVTMTLVQGVVNTFVVFLSRVVGYFVDRAISRDNNNSQGIGYTITVIVSQIVFGIAASVIVAWFSRHREFRADAGAAKLLGSPQPMMKALARLGGIEPTSLPEGLASLGINDKPGFAALFSSHPPIEDRIAALRSLQ
ncbi:Protease HtpX [compost metagenome]|jgi:heat shock protein HtpX|uniref:Protease HtpX homolog n=1 Tax=Janthinobacterium sp. (strain Marseille) TaxID=375286 RepID=HTPX_JANMA|nr:protease HtpX [Janthinobacterium sp. Marseille]A6SXH1.1 RecName: Full=Protease HtpX homolog [Janthinobacterium sp. Marseille]ABR89198.1 heat shock protein HtpX [Janthinobacterium sp. Marseille]